MFNKDLFLSLCEKYNVEMSANATSPMIKDRGKIHEITVDDMNRIFSPCQIFFDYSDNKTNAKIEFSAFYMQEEYAIAC